MTNTVLFITAFKSLNREFWTGWERSDDEYLNYFKNLSLLPIRLICFCEDNIKNILNDKYQFNNTYPYEPDDTFLKFIDTEKKIMESIEFINLTKHISDPNVNKPGYNSVNHNKVWFIKRAKKMFPNYTHYAWIDFGFFRVSNIPEQLDFNKLGDKIEYCSLDLINIDNLLNPIDALIKIKDYPTLCGSSFICPNNLVEWYYDIYYNMVMLYYLNNIVDDDQEIVKQILRIHSDKFKIIIQTNWFTHLNLYTVPLTIDIVIPTCLKDINTLNIVIKNAKINISNIGNIYIICNYNLRNYISEGIFIDEDSFPFNKKNIAEYIFGDINIYNNRDCSWLYQQLLKLYSPIIINNISSNVLIIDSETIFYNNYNPIQNNIAYYAVSNEICLDYRKHIKFLLKDINILYDNISGICHQMLFQKHVIQNLFDRVEKYNIDLNNINLPFWKLMLIKLKENNINKYSEYDLYFNFINTFHRNTIKITNDISWDISSTIPKSSKYTYLTVH